MCAMCIRNACAKAVLPPYQLQLRPERWNARGRGHGSGVQRFGGPSSQGQILAVRILAVKLRNSEILMLLWIFAWIFPPRGGGNPNKRPQDMNQKTPRKFARKCVQEKYPRISGASLFFTCGRRPSEFDPSFQQFGVSDNPSRLSP